MNENSQSKSSLKIIVKSDLKKKEKKRFAKTIHPYKHNWPLQPFNHNY